MYRCTLQTSCSFQSIVTSLKPYPHTNPTPSKLHPVTQSPVITEPLSSHPQLHKAIRHNGRILWSWQFNLSSESTTKTNRIHAYSTSFHHAHNNWSFIPQCEIWNLKQWEHTDTSSRAKKEGKESKKEYKNMWQLSHENFVSQISYRRKWTIIW